MPVTAVFTILRDAQDPKIRHEWQDFLAKRGRLDMVVVRSEDKLNGLEGTFGPGKRRRHRIHRRRQRPEANDPPRPGPGIDLRPEAGPGRPAPLCKVTDAVGNLLVAADVVLNGDGLTVTTVSGARVTLPDVKRLAKLDFSKGKLAYLSDLTPSRDARTLGDRGRRPVRPVRPLSQGRRTSTTSRSSWAASSIEKGITLHAGTQLVYADRRRITRNSGPTLGVDDGGRDRKPRSKCSSRATAGSCSAARRAARTRRGRSPWTSAACETCGSRSGRPGLLDFGDQAVLADAKVSK